LFDYKYCWGTPINYDDLNNCSDITGGALSTEVVEKENAGSEVNVCMMMLEIKNGGNQLTKVPVPNDDRNWKTSVSIGGVVCIILCAI
jgi:hypothetical protein